MTIIICDDDKKDLTSLRTHIENFAREQQVEFEIIEVAHLTGIEDLEVFMEQQTINAIFLDIDMPYITGDVVAEKMSAKYPETKIIFYTNRDELVYDMIKYKPFRFIRKRCPDEIKDALMAFTQSMIGTGHIFVVKNRAEVEKIPVSEIRYVETLKHQVIYHMIGENIYARGSMSQCNRDLENYGFLRVHHAYLINIKFIQHISRKEVLLKDGTIVPVGGSYKQEMMKNYKIILERFKYGRSY